MLTLADIVNATCPNPAERTAWRSYLQRCLGEEEVRKICLGDQHPMYPEASLPFFRRIAELRELGYKAGGLAAQIRAEQKDANRVDRKPISDQRDYPKIDQPALPASMEMTVQPQQVTDLVSQVGEYLATQIAARVAVQPQQVTDLVEQVGEYLAAHTVQRLAEQLLPPPDDRLIRAPAAADLLACGVDSVHQYLSKRGVDPVELRPRRWRRSDILRLIQRL